MALSDVVVFNEYARDAYIETDSQNIDLFNAASRGAIQLSTKANEGSFAHRSFIADTAGLIRARNPDSAAAIASIAIQQKDAVTVKVARGTPPVRVNHSDWTWIQQSPADAGVAYGRQMAVSGFAEKLNTAMGVGYAALVNDGTNVLDLTGTADPKASIANLVLGAAKMGDKAGQLAAWVMHSKSLHDIYASAVANGAQLFNIGNVQVTQDAFGRILIMTDSPNLVTTAGSVTTYHILGLVQGALVVEDNADMFTNVSTVNGTDTLQTTIQSEWTYNVGVKGYAYDVAAGKAPSNATLFTGANWDKVATSNKNTAGVVIEVK